MFLVCVKVSVLLQSKLSAFIGGSALLDAPRRLLSLIGFAADGERSDWLGGRQLPVLPRGWFRRIPRSQPSSSSYVSVLSTKRVYWELSI